MSKVSISVILLVIAILTTANFIPSTGFFAYLNFSMHLVPAILIIILTPIALALILFLLGLLASYISFLIASRKEK